MMEISARDYDYQALNRVIKASTTDIVVKDCCGERFMAAGKNDHHITLHGTPGNALGAYLDGANIEVFGNVQDAVGDTMNQGSIVVHGDAGDALGYAMRGGHIYVEGKAGYRTGIHMKQYEDHKPVIVVGGTVGSFLGEYLAGGLIVVLGLGATTAPVGYFTGTGMHGGRIFIRTKEALKNLPAQVIAETATPVDLEEIAPHLQAFATHFGLDAKALLNDHYVLLTPNAKNPYRQLYTHN